MPEGRCGGDAMTISVGDIIPIRIINAPHLIGCRGRVTAISGGTIAFIYTDDSPIFAGLRGLIR